LHYQQQLQVHSPKNLHTGCSYLQNKYRGQDVEIKEYFTTDSTAQFFGWPCHHKILSDANHQSFCSISGCTGSLNKKAAIYTPESYEAMAALPTLHLCQALKPNKFPVSIAPKW